MSRRRVGPGSPSEGPREAPPNPVPLKPETDAVTISLPIELIDRVRQWASHSEIGLDEQIARLLEHALGQKRLV